VRRESSLADLLAPFEINLTSRQKEQILIYLELLLRWNRKINLTAVNTPGECVTRHFGESLYLGVVMSLEGRLLDIGSGAGFPGLALKVAFPALETRLLEPDVKKCAFLKEAVRLCGFSGVEIRRQRLEDYRYSIDFVPAEVVTSRAVGGLDKLIPLASECLTAEGSLCLWTTSRLFEHITGISGHVAWVRRVRVPKSRERVILIGRKLGGTRGDAV
jgi:16S rRNA (guanine527-N7)-methyltransferase